MPSETPMTRESSTDLRNIAEHENDDETANDKSPRRANSHGVDSNDSGARESDEEIDNLLPDINSPLVMKKRNGSSGTITAEIKPEGRVLVLYTGGTIGMVRNDKGGNRDILKN